MITLRAATAADAGEILRIYAPYVLATAISFETEVPSVKDMESKIDKCLKMYPWVVLENKNTIGGYVYGSIHREREAYQWTCECSIYLDESYKGKGVGGILYKTLFKILKEQGFVNLYAGITLPNEASIKLHESLGFVSFADYENVGYKFGAWHNVRWWKFQMNELQLKPPPPVPFSHLSENYLSELYLQTAKDINAKLIG